jgi:biotin synthase
MEVLVDEPIGRTLSHGELERWLLETDPARLELLWRAADATRRLQVGDAVHFRGLLEISNHCLRQCFYCGLRAGNREVSRYRMTATEILAGARQAQAYGYGTLVMQAGEDDGLTREWVADVVRRIKGETPLAVTLSLGERLPDELAAWREAGADRYLLRFETSNGALYEKIHPARHGRELDRFELLRLLGELGFEVGSGVMIGIPGQSYDDLVRDLELFRELDLDMIGVGPFIPHPATPLGDDGEAAQVPNDELMTYKMIALARLTCPPANIPSTTALATINPVDGRERGLQRGANVVMPNITPPAYRVQYEIYPGKAGVHESAAMCHERMQHRIALVGRPMGKGPGGARAKPAPQ